MSSIKKVFDYTGQILDLGISYRHISNPLTPTNEELNQEKIPLSDRILGLAIYILFAPTIILPCLFLYWAKRKVELVNLNIENKFNASQSNTPINNQSSSILVSQSKDQTLTAHKAIEKINSTKVPFNKYEAIQKIEDIKKPQNFNLETNCFGNKFAGLDMVEKFIQKYQLENVFVPKKSGISHVETVSLLEQKVPEVLNSWNGLKNQFNHLSSNDRTHFLESQDVKKELAFIRNEIQQAFSHDSIKHFNSSLCTWLEEIKIKGSYLMVRSSGNEDSKNVVNAGGNLSERYINPTSDDVLPSAGRVIASYFSEFSLKQQLDAGGDPFNEPLQLSVLLNELIGESPDQIGSIPTSAVLFTNEPHYSEGNFNVTTLSSSFGHGEGVVNNSGVKTDTFYMVSSPGNPGTIAKTINTQIKPNRLAPLRKNGTVSLELVDNLPQMSSQPSLSNAVLNKIFNLSRLIENEYKIPMDLELVVKDEMIYIVQMRPIKRIQTQASFLDINKVQSQNAILFKPIQTKPLIHGQANVQTINSPSEILICPTLKNASEQYKNGVHKIVIVAKDEPANSHPMVTFRGKGIPCFCCSEELSALRSYVKKLDAKHSIMVCPQSGNILLVNKKITDKDCIVAGYFDHPAPMSPSIKEGFDGALNLISGFKLRANLQIQEAIHALKASQTKEASLEVLKNLRKSINAFNLQGRIANLEQNQLSKPSAFKLAKLKSLDKRINKVFKDVQACINNENTSRFEKFYHIKHLSALLGNENGDGLNVISLQHTNKIEESILKEVAFEKKVGKLSRLVELLYIGEMGFSDESTTLWNEFLLKLENESQESIQELKNLICQLETFQILPLWFNQIFLPTNVKATNAKTLLTDLTKELKNYSKDIVELKAKFKELESLEFSIADYGDPNSFDSSWAKMKPFLSFITSKEFTNTLISESHLVKLVANSVMLKFIELMDSSIKEMKGSTNFTDEEKLGKLNLMLKTNYEVMKCWANLLDSKVKIPIHVNNSNSENLSDYLDMLEEQWNKILLKDFSENRFGILDASPDFSVGAAKLGSKAQFFRHLPQTLEDIFTLIHQNQLFLSSRCNLLDSAEESLSSMHLPKEMEEVVEFFDKYKSYFKNAIRQGIEVDTKEIRIDYTIPMICHSLGLQIIWNKASGLHIKCHFMGERGSSRWQTTAKLAEILNAGKEIKIYSTEPYTEQEVKLQCDISSVKEWEWFQFIVLGIMMPLADQNRFTSDDIEKNLKKVSFDMQFYLAESIITSTDFTMKVNNEVERTGLYYHLPEILKNINKEKKELLFAKLNQILDQYGTQLSNADIDREKIHLKRLNYMFHYLKGDSEVNQILQRCNNILTKYK